MYQYFMINMENSNEIMTYGGNIGTLGIEVTIPAIAERCNLGNIDPQHSGGSNVSACVEALEFPLPPDGASLVTVRPDADSILAMAILAIRLARRVPDVGKVRIIGTCDSAPAGPWRRDYTPPKEFAQANVVAMDHKLSMRQRVEILTEWLMGELDLPDPPSVKAVDVDVRLSACGRYAVVRADGPAGREACRMGYLVAPVVVTVNNAFAVGGVTPHLKYTIARWNATHVPMDWDGMLEKLRALEPGWGGSSSICGSTQNVSSSVSVEQIISIVEESLPGA